MQRHHKAADPDSEVYECECDIEGGCECEIDVAAYPPESPEQRVEPIDSSTSANPPNSKPQEKPVPPSEPETPSPSPTPQPQPQPIEIPSTPHDQDPSPTPSDTSKTPPPPTSPSDEQIIKNPTGETPTQEAVPVVIVTGTTADPETPPSLSPSPPSPPNKEGNGGNGHSGDGNMIQLPDTTGNGNFGGEKPLEETAKNNDVVSPVVDPNQVICDKPGTESVIDEATKVHNISHTEGDSHGHAVDKLDKTEIKAEDPGIPVEKNTANSETANNGPNISPINSCSNDEPLFTQLQCPLVDDMCFINYTFPQPTVKERLCTIETKKQPNDIQEKKQDNPTANTIPPETPSHSPPPTPFPASSDPPPALPPNSNPQHNSQKVPKQDNKQKRHPKEPHVSEKYSNLGFVLGSSPQTVSTTLYCWCTIYFDYLTYI